MNEPDTPGSPESEPPPERKPTTAADVLANILWTILVVFGLVLGTCALMNATH